MVVLRFFGVALLSLLRQMDASEEKNDPLHRQIEAWHRTSEVKQRLATIPGVGATAVLRRAAHAQTQTQTSVWIQRLLEKKPARLVSVALANSERRCATGSSTPHQ